jgi:predicted NBD/HSP70 family sugar kinase
MKYIDEIQVPPSRPAGCGPLLQRSKASDAPLRQQVFQHVRASGRAARADITRALDISAGSATTLTADLIASGLLREVNEPAREQSRGRPPVALEVVPDAAFVIGIKLSSKRHTAVMADFAGNTVATATVPSSNRRRHAVQLLDEIEALVNLTLENGSKRADDIKAVGIGVPGLVDHATSLVNWCSILHGINQDLRTGFAQRFDMPVFFDNDTNMLTLGELWYGDGRDMTDFAVVTIENGVGMGLVVNNQLYRGTHGIGLELGHTKVQLDGALCRCGQRGCLEAYLGDYALIREAATALEPDGVDAKDPEALLAVLFAQAKAGNAAAEAIFSRAGRYLAVGLSNVVQLFDPPFIILAGDRMQYEYFYAKEVFAEMQSLTLSDVRRPCKVVVHGWDDMVWARGATAPALTALTDTMAGGLEMQSG